MANSPTAEVLTVWIDEAGQSKGFGFHILVTPTAANPNITTMTAAAQEVIAALEAVTDCKFVGATLTMPFAASAGAGKSSADSDSRARRHAKTFWNGATDENALVEIAEIGIPDPQAADVDTTLPQPALKTSGSNYTALVAAITGKAKTRGGEPIASYKGSIIQQRPVTKTSRQ